MTLFLREDSRKTPAPKRLRNSPVEDGSVDDASEICFSLDRSDPCAFGVTVQSAESCEISGPLCTVQPMETCEAFSPIIPPAPSSAGLLNRDWKSSVLQDANDIDEDDDWYIDNSCQHFIDDYEAAGRFVTDSCCRYHREFYNNNPDFEVLECTEDWCWDVSEPAPMTKEVTRIPVPPPFPAKPLSGPSSVAKFRCNLSHIRQQYLIRVNFWDDFTFEELSYKWWL